MAEKCSCVFGSFRCVSSRRLINFKVTSSGFSLGMWFVPIWKIIFSISYLLASSLIRSGIFSIFPPLIDIVSEFLWLVIFFASINRTIESPIINNFNLPRLLLIIFFSVCFFSSSAPRDLSPIFETRVLLFSFKLFSFK